jgi:hypothetical protein
VVSRLGAPVFPSQSTRPSVLPRPSNLVENYLLLSQNSQGWLAIYLTRIATFLPHSCVSLGWQHPRRAALPFVSRFYCGLRVRLPLAMPLTWQELAPPPPPRCCRFC